MLLCERFGRSGHMHANPRPPGTFAPILYSGQKPEVSLATAEDALKHLLGGNKGLHLELYRGGKGGATDALVILGKCVV